MARTTCRYCGNPDPTGYGLCDSYECGNRDNAEAEDPMSEEETHAMLAFTFPGEYPEERNDKGHLLWLREDGVRR